jgi:hypothetical protein
MYKKQKKRETHLNIFCRFERQRAEDTIRTVECVKRNRPLRIRLPYRRRIARSLERIDTLATAGKREMFLENRVILALYLIEVNLREDEGREGEVAH